MIAMEHLLPAGPDDFVRSFDVATLGERLAVVETHVAFLKSDAAVLKSEITGLRIHAEDLKQQLARVQEGVVSLGTKIDAARIEAKSELLAAAVHTQTKTIVLALTGTLVVLSALMFAFSQLTAGI